MTLYIKVFAAFLAALLGVIWGAWWATIVVGIAVGVVEGRARTAVPAGAAIGLLAWVAPLAVGQVRYGLGPTAESLAAIMGFGHVGAVAVVLTVLVGTLLGMTGAWLGSAIRAVARPAVR